MSNLERRVGTGKAPFLRVFYGDESDAPQRDAQFSDDRQPQSSREDEEIIWAGRVLANRLSARIAA